MYRRECTRPELQTMFVIRARCLHTGRVKHPIDGETSFHFITNQMNCYIYNGIYIYRTKINNRLHNLS